MYEKGEGAPQDLAEAARVFGAAAQLGDREAQNNFAVMLDNGRGVAADPASAMTWFQKAARQGDVAAQINLGRKYLGSAASTDNLISAYAWFNLAASSGNSEADNLKRSVAIRLSREQVQQAQKLSTTLLSGDE
jgi:TPR repeat protein